MRLISKFTLLYLAITAVVLLIGGVIVFNAVLHEVDREAKIKLKAWLHITVEQIKSGVPIDQLDINNVDIVEMPLDEPMIPFYLIDSTGIFPPKLRGEDRKLTVGASYKINGKHYHVSTFNFIAEPDEIQAGLKRSLFIIFLIFVFFLGLVSLFISRQILRPFNKALGDISAFNLKNQKPILANNKTNTKEFRQLNLFLEKMTQKALKDYGTLKEFSENASHEIRTPLAIIRGKLELLIETSINEEQARHINSIENAVQKLSSINHSLLLLTKLENQEYEATENIDLSKVLNTTLLVFEELIEMKSLLLTKEVKEDVTLKINPFLAELMFNNLIGNAIRHNVEGGSIFISLSNQSFIIKNTGVPLQVEPQELFKRFKKNNQSVDSTGLGLSIVKQICDINDLDISYEVVENEHIISVYFR